MRVHQNQVEGARAASFQRRLAVADDGQVHAVAQDRLDDPLVDGMVLGQQHLLAALRTKQTVR